jgi:hypothetical protein
MFAALSSWKRRTVVLVGEAADSSALRSLAGRGAQTASVRLLSGTLEFTAVLEGASRAIREIRRRIAGGPRIIAVRTSGADACRLAGIHIHAALTPAIENAVAVLRSAGLNAAQSWSVVDGYVQFAMRALRKAGRRPALLALSDQAREELLAQLESLPSSGAHSK